jgi:hypothetical protein
MKMLLRYSYYPFSMVDFKTICNFNALLKARTEKKIKIVLLFLLFSKKLETSLISKAFITCTLKRIHIKSKIPQLK